MTQNQDWMKCGSLWKMGNAPIKGNPVPESRSSKRPQSRSLSFSQFWIHANYCWASVLTALNLFGFYSWRVLLFLLHWFDWYFVYLLLSGHFCLSRVLVLLPVFSLCSAVFTWAQFPPVRSFWVSVLLLCCDTFYSCFWIHFVLTVEFQPNRRLTFVLLLIWGWVTRAAPLSTQPPHPAYPGEP